VFCHCGSGIVQLYACVHRLSDMIGIVFRYHAVFYLLFGLLMFITFAVWMVVGIMNPLYCSSCIWITL
jgi:hypothetical protein